MKTLMNRPEMARMLPLARKETKETLLNRAEMIRNVLRMLPRQHVCTSYVKIIKTLINRPERARMLPRQHVCTI